MSKTTLKRTLSSMTASQMAELIVQLYEARKEAKEYLDFFVDPDIDKRLEKAKINIRKELMRTSRGRNRGRSTRIKRYIKDISSLDPGVEPVLEIMTYAVVTACKVGGEQWVKETTQRAVAKMLTETLQLADVSGMIDVYLPKIESAVKSMASVPYYCREYREKMCQAIRDFIE